MPKTVDLAVDGDEYFKPWLRPNEFHPPMARQPVGCMVGDFDIGHSGHLYFIQKAKEQCATLVAGLYSDEFIMNQQGSFYPILTFLERYNFLSLTGVDYIIEITNKKDIEDLKKYTKPIIEFVDGEGTALCKCRRTIKFLPTGRMKTATVVDRILTRNQLEELT